MNDETLERVMDHMLTMQGRIMALNKAMSIVSLALGDLDPNLRAKFQRAVALAADEMEAEEDGEIAVQEALYELQAML